MLRLPWYHAARPNVLLVVLDQLRSDRLTVHPVFGCLEKRGVFFPCVVTYAPYTIASMPAIFSGIYGSRNGVNAYYRSTAFDHANCLLLSELLQRAGYRTFGDTINVLVLPDRGFDRLAIHDENRDDLTARHSVLLREVVRQEPFFLYLHYSGIHTEIVRNVIKVYDETDPQYFGRLSENARRYDEYVFRAGEYLAELLVTFDDLSLAERTLLVVLTDHGCSLGERPGEKAYGVYLYDYTVRTFAYFAWPGRLPAGAEVDAQVRTVDIVPTILRLLALQPPSGFRVMDGTSLLPLIGGQPEDRLAFMETGGLTGPYPSPNVPNMHGVRTGDWKLIHNSTTGATEMYDLRRDPSETIDVVDQVPEVKEVLMRQLKELRDGS